MREGGPVFVGYGRLLVGSQVIQTTQDFFDTELGIPKNTNTRFGQSRFAITWGSTEHGINTSVQGGMEGKVKDRIIQIGTPQKEN